MVPNPTKIKTVYSFVAAEIMLDLDTPMDKAMVQQIHSYAYQNIRQKNPELNRFFSQAEKENTPYVLGTGIATSPDGCPVAFADWLKSKGINIADADRKKKISIFTGRIQNPQNGLSFNWASLIYFDIEE